MPRLVTNFELMCELIRLRKANIIPQKVSPTCTNLFGNIADGFCVLLSARVYKKVGDRLVTVKKRLQVSPFIVSRSKKRLVTGNRAIFCSFGSRSLQCEYQNMAYFRRREMCELVLLIDKRLYYTTI